MHEIQRLVGPMDWGEGERRVIFLVSSIVSFFQDEKRPENV